MNRTIRLASLGIFSISLLFSCASSSTTNYFIVNFDTDGGSFIKSQKIEDGSQATKPANPEKTDYTFDKWTLDGSEYKFTEPVTKDITLKAKWIGGPEPIKPIWIVTFESNGGDHIETQKVTDGEKADKPTDPTKKDYKFKGWFAKPDFSGSIYTFDEKVTDDITLYAKWEKDVTYYKFNFIGDHCSLNNEEKYQENQIVNLTFTVADGYELPDGINVIGTGGAYNYSKTNKTLSLTMIDNVTVVCYAQRKTYQVDFYIDGTIRPELRQSVLGGQYVQRPETPVKDKCIFDGWYVNESCTGNKYSFDSVVGSEIKLYGKFRPDEDLYYDITFSASDAGGYFNNDPTCKSLTYSYKYGSTISNAPIPYKPSDGSVSYSFNGWELKKVTESTIYKAEFTPHTNAFTIRWLNYDLTILRTDTVDYGDLPTYSGDIPTRNSDFEGSYTFTGWSPDIVPAIMDMAYIAKFDIDVSNSSYPQTLLTDSSIIAELEKISVVDEKGYKTYKGNKYYKFTSIQQYISDDGTEVAQGESNYYKVEPIKWKTLKIDYAEKERLVISEKILDATKWQEYFTGEKELTDYQGDTDWVYCNNYKYSLMRTFLNTTFLNRAFDDSDIIPVSEVDNSASTTRNFNDNPFACENTFDKLFPLSYKDMKGTDYFPDAESKKSAKTDYARANRAFPIFEIDEYHKYGQYATRSPRIWNNDTDSVDRVSDTGTIPFEDIGSASAIFGVRPAILAEL